MGSGTLPVLASTEILCWNALSATSKLELSPDSTPGKDIPIYHYFVCDLLRGATNHSCSIVAKWLSTVNERGRICMFYGKCVREPPLQSSEEKYGKNTEKYRGVGLWACTYSDLSENWHLATEDDGIVSKFVLHLQKKPMQNCANRLFDALLAKFCGLKEILLAETGIGIAQGSRGAHLSRLGCHQGVAGDHQGAAGEGPVLGSGVAE